ncbi:MAG: precorrin-3B C(17)-methyltransferase [Alphaproteobacteria bacterium]|nr:precorrin-3B C(17)-methyltransferase [Alphaproteobacteria bacterium]
MHPIIFILGASALPLAQKLKAEFGFEIHGPEGVSGCDVTYLKAADHLASSFALRRAILGLCASGILIRALAKHISDKHNEPAVIAVAEDGSSVIPLLGGHHGANHLAKRIADFTKGHAAITTASEVRFGASLDEPKPGYVLGNPQDMKSATAALLNGASLAILDEAESPIELQNVKIEKWSPTFDGITIEVTEKNVKGGPRHLVYHPLTLAVGLGCERGTDPQEVRTLIKETLTAKNISRRSIVTYASIDVKEDEPAITDQYKVVYFTAEELNAQSAKLHTPSEIVCAEVGTPSVAEASALAAAGPDAELIVPKAKSKRATIAIAKAPKPIDTPAGRARGEVSVVGIGPGTSFMRSPYATHLLTMATEWVGYGLYLDLVADMNWGQTEHRFPLGDEEARCRHAIELAKQGKNVALVCSGDAAIYAMAALVYELIDREPNRIAINVCPGISAFQAASAKAGAMIGHDFCCISLSDLLTPWEAIEKRIKAAAEGDFVISFYNPRSLKRRDQLERAFAILKNHRPPNTPVVIASNLGRPEENVRIRKFSEFDPNEVDMLTLVMVGSSQSKSITRGDGKTYAYTPRGYAKKMDSK